MVTTAELPRWDMEVVFPGLDSAEFEAAVSSLQEKIAGLDQTFRQYRIGLPDSQAGIEIYDNITNRLNATLEDLRTINAYIHAFVTTDSRNELALARRSEMDPILARLRKVGKSYTAWIGSLEVEELLKQSELAKAHEYAVRKAKVSAEHLMSPAEEALISDVETTGSIAWTKLYGSITSQLEVEIDGERLPMSAVRALAYDPDREKRRRAYEAELAAWKASEVPIAAALNSIKGETITLCDKRGWESPLDEALFGANIDRQTLDAMLSAARESFPDFRRYLWAKAKALGLQKLAFYDIFAPVGGSDKQWEYFDAAAFVVNQFKGYSDTLGKFAARSFRENWIDVEPRPGKVDGAYCMSLRKDESRILMNFKPAFGSVSTLAHELGHGYHNLCLADRSALQRATPMTLAETASIFCETIIRQAVLKNGTPEEQFLVLEASLQGSCQVVVDITSRYLFESGVIEQRRKRELTPRELCELMRQSQLDTYGDGLDPEALHPYMWAAKGHYYGRSFYNFPYMFGLLFGLGLYTVYQQEGESFKERYDELLSSTGLADAATLASGFGIDIRTPEFWRGSLDQIRADVDRFEQLVGV